MSDLSIQGEVVVNSEKAESAFDRVGDKASQMANEVATSAGKAGQAVDKIGDGAGASAEKFTRAESRISASIKRATNELELLGKTASQRLEFNIADKGLDAAKFEPALKKLREIEAQALQAQRAATGSLDKMGISAGQTAAALRQLPAQFTDIVTSLQGGQAPLTVLLQQGGQIKDSFGGAGSAVRALGGYVAGLVNPVTMAAAAIATIAVAYKQGSAEADAYNKAIITTGNAAGTTASQMQQMAQRISAVVGTQAAAAETLAGLAGSSRIAAENFEYFGTVALKVEKTVGTSVAETVKQFAELGKAPVEASKKLTEETNYLTQSIYEQIKALKDQGREADAASVAQKAWADSLNNRSAEMTQNLGLIEKAWKGVAGAAKSGWDAMLNVGRSSSMADQLANVRQQIAQAQGQDKNRPFSLPWDTPLADLQQRLSYLTEEERLMKRGAAAQAERAQAEKAAIEATDALGKANEKAFTKQEQMNKALDDYRANLEKVRAVNPNSALLDPAQVAKSEKAIREQFAERTAAVRKGNDELQKQADLIAKLSGLDPSFSREWDMLSKAYKSGALNLDQLVDAQAALLSKQPAMTAQIKAQAEAEKERAKSAADLAKTLEAYAKAQQEGVAQGFQAAQQAEDQLAQYGMLKSEVQALTLAYLEQSRESAALAGEDVSNIDKRIAAQKRLISATSGIEQRDAAKKAAQDAEAEWKRTADSINQSLTDALLRGFESGKDFAKNLRDTVVNMLKTMVLRPVVSAIVSPVAGAITGALGLSTAAQAGQGGASSGVSTALSGASLLGSVGGSLAAGAGWLTGATTLGGSLSAGMSLLGTGSLAGAGAGLGMLAGALGPIALGIGLLSSAFSRKLKDQGIQGTLGGEAGFEGQQYRFYEGGLFRSDKTTYSAIDPELARVLSGVFSAVQDQVTDFAEALSLPTDRIKGFTTDIKVSFKGLDEAGIQKALQDALATGSNELAQQVLGTLTTTTREVTETLAGGMGDWGDGTMQAVTRTIEETTYAASEYAREGEKAIDTLTRLSTSLGTVNTIWENLGFTLYDASLRGADAASKMADAFGGLENLAAVTGVYYDNFYSEAEKAANVTRDITAALADVGLQMPATRQEFRALVEAQMALGESGTKAVAALLGVAGAFASVTAAVQSEQAAERADRLAAQRAREKQAAEALQKQIEAYADGAEQFNTLRDSLLKAGDAAGLLAAMTERAFADPSGRYMNGRYELPRWEEGTTAAGYNYQYGMMQRRLIGQAINDASFNALRIQNVSGLLGDLFQRAAPNEYDTVSGPIRQAIQQAIVGASGDMSNAVRDAVSGAALYAATSGTGFSTNEPGLAAIRNARAAASSASLYSRDSETGLYRIGGGAVAYGQALDNLKGTLNTGKITTDQFTRAVEALNEALPGAADSLGTFADLVAVQQGANYGIGLAGLESIKFYFKSLISLSDDFTKAAEVAAEPIAKATEVINRLGSVQHVFSESTRAALDGFKGAGAYGRATLDDPETADSISRANAIAEAAGIAASVLTTADAAAAAVKLAKSPAFAELDAAGIRDASLLLDGISQYNAQGFEVAFTRISAALAKGNVTEAQYKALFDTALGMFNGVPEETRTLIDSMTRLRDAMSGFADGLLIDEQRTTLSAGSTLAEMQRQYAQAFAGAATGDNEAIGKYQQLATTLLDKQLYSTQAEYNAAFGSVYGDARQLEAIGVNTIANAQGDAMVSELKDMNAKLNKRVEDLEKNLLAALAQIAKNTSDTSRGIEQQIVMAEDTP